MILLRRRHRTTTMIATNINRHCASISDVSAGMVPIIIVHCFVVFFKYMLIYEIEKNIFIIK